MNLFTCLQLIRLTKELKLRPENQGSRLCHSLGRHLLPEIKKLLMSGVMMNSTHLSLPPPQCLHHSPWAPWSLCLLELLWFPLVLWAPERPEQRLETNVTLSERENINIRLQTFHPPSFNILDEKHHEQNWDQGQRNTLLGCYRTWTHRCESQEGRVHNVKLLKISVVFIWIQSSSDAATSRMEKV